MGMKCTIVQQKEEAIVSSHNISRARELLHRIAASWGERAYVRKAELSPLYDPDKPDFLVTLLPFKEHPAFLNSTQEMQQQILSCGWLAYNEKTVAIETAIVFPACMHILRQEVPGLEDETSQKIICETLVDESYHVLLVKNANRIVRINRDLSFVSIPEFNLVKQMQACQAMHDEAWQKRLIQLATAIVSEIFISDYLGLLSEDESIQPLNRMTVAAHRHDELAHSSIFKSFTKCMWAGFDAKQKRFFALTLPKPIRWFADLELEVWRGMLRQVGFAQADSMIQDCIPLNKRSLERVNYSGLLLLAEEFGILEDRDVRNSFVEQGVLAG